MTHLSELVTLAGPNLVFPQHDPLDHSIAGLYQYLVRQGQTATYAGAAAAVDLDYTSPAFRRLEHELKLRLLAAITMPTGEGRAGLDRQHRFLYVWKIIALAKQLRQHVN